MRTHEGSFSFSRSKSAMHIGGIALVTIIFQWLTGYDFEFHRDELLYLSLGERPDWGYYSVPPFIGFLAYISLKLFGYTLFAARFFPALAGGLLIYIVSLIVKELKGGTYAQVLAAIGIAGSILYIRAFGLFQPVPFDILFWTWSIYLFVKYLNSGKSVLLILLGVSVAIGFLNKYTILFLVFSLFIAILPTRHRKILLMKHTWISASIAVCIVLPNILWQVKHDFPVVDHMRELQSSQLVNVSPATFLSEQILMVIPSSIIVFPGLILLFLIKPMKEYRVLGFFSIAVFILFLLLQGKTYYTAGIYPVLTAVSAVIFEKYSSKLFPRILLISIILGLETLFLPMGKPISVPGKMVEYFDRMEEITGNDAIRRDEDNGYNRLPQDYADMLGWKELTGIASRAWQKIENKDKAFIYCENYGQAGAINIIGKKFGLPDAISFNDQFRYWAPAQFDTEITHIVYINDEVGEDVRKLFAEIEEIGKINNPLAREYGTGVYLCSEPVRSFNGFWKERRE